MAFVKNNIRFRSVAAKSLEFFYNAKAFMLNDLIDDKNQFSEVARETLLLLFNSYSDWTKEIEYLLIKKPIVSEIDINVVLVRLNKLTEQHRNIFEIHTDVFTPSFIQQWLPAHEHTHAAFIAKVKATIGDSQFEAFPKIVGALVTMLQSTMYELYEVDCLLGGNFVADRCTANRSNTNRLVMYVDNFALDYYKDTGIFPLTERVKIYLKACCTKTLPVVIKNYSSEVVRMQNGTIEGDEPLASLLKQLSESFAFILEVVSVPPVKSK